MGKSAEYGPRGIADYLAERISTGQFTAGSQIHSIRGLAGQFAASFATVRSAVSLLCEEGLVEKRHGSGVYVKRTNAVGGRLSRRVAVMQKGDSFWVGIYSTAFLGIQKAAEAKGVSLQLDFSPKDAKGERSNEVLSRVDGAILLGADEYGDSYKTYHLHNPIVALCSHDSNGGRISVVDIDPFLAAEQAAAYFTSRRVKTVGVVSAAGPAFVNRGKVFESLWRGQGGSVEFHQHGSAVNFERRKGYLFTTHSILQVYSEKHLEKTGKPLSETVPVLGIDGKNRIDPSFHPAPTIALDWKVAGECAFDELLFRIEHPGSVPKRIYLPGELHE